MNERLKRTLILIAVILAAVLVLSACVRGGSGGTGGKTPPTPTDCNCTLEGPAAPTATPLQQQGPSSLAEPGQTGTPGETGAAAVQPPLSPTAAPTQPPGLDPEDWREWPVVPTRISGELQSVYQRGLAAGNRPDRFSKVGDCQSIKEAMMGYFDMPGRYRLPEGKDYLAEAIEHFQGSFNRDGQGVKGGYNAAAVLSPMWADPQVCQPGETPLDCELRTYQPSIVLISLEVWWDGRTPDRYVAYMRQIIERSLEKGVVPVLSTKADNVEGDHAINLATARLAAEYDLPLWNFWAAAQKLPNGGLDPTRPDGFHISYEAWNIRSRTALEAVDAVWRLLNEQDVPLEPTAAPTSAVTARPSATLLPRRTLAGADFAVETLAEPAEQPNLLLEVSEREEDVSRSAGVYRLPLSAGGDADRMTPGGVRLLDSAPNGDFLLQDVDGTWLASAREWIQLGEPGGAYLAGDLTSAVLLDESGLSLQPLDGSARRPLETGGSPDAPAALLPAPAAGRVFWTAPAGEELSEVWGSPLDGGEAEYLGQFRRPSVSPDGRWLVSWSAPEGDNEVMLLRDLNSGSERSLRLPSGLFSGAAWSPDGRSLAVALSHRSDYSGRVFGSQVVLVDPAGLGVRQLGEQEGLNPALLFSPDGRTLYRAATVGDLDGYRLALLAVDLASGRAAEVPLDLRSEDFLWLSAWSAR